MEQIMKHLEINGEDLYRDHKYFQSLNFYCGYLSNRNVYIRVYQRTCSKTLKQHDFISPRLQTIHTYISSKQMKGAAMDPVEDGTVREIK